MDLYYDIAAFLDVKFSPFPSEAIVEGLCFIQCSICLPPGVHLCRVRVLEGNAISGYKILSPVTRLASYIS